MNKYLIRLGILGTLTFLCLFFYLYKKSGKFRKSIISAFVAVSISLSSVTGAHASSEADAFTTPNPQRLSRVQRPEGIFTNRSPNDDSGPGKPNKNGLGGGGIPNYPKPESVEKTKELVTQMEKQFARMNEVCDSDSDLESEENQFLVEGKAESDKINLPTPKIDASPIRKTGTIIVKRDKKIVRFEGPVLQPEAFEQFDPALSVADRQTMLDDLPQIMEYKQAENIIADLLGPLNNPRMHHFDESKKYAANYYTIVGKLYHLGESGFSVESYGVTDSQLAFLQKFSLKQYVSRGGKLSNEECLQMAIKIHQDFFEKNLPTVHVDAAFQG